MYAKKIFIGLFFLYFSLFENHKLYSQTKSPSKNIKNLTLEKAIQFVLDRSITVRLEQLEILKSDINLRKENAKFNPVLEGGQENQVTKLRYTNSFTSGDTIKKNKTYLRAKKLFSTGTYFETEVFQNRQKSEEIVNPAFANITGGDNDIFTPSSLYTTGLKLVLRQELLRNGFGYVDRRKNKIEKNKIQIMRKNLIHRLNLLIVNTIIDFWNIVVKEKNVETTQKLLKNTQNIYKITYRKRRLGLSEKFEIKQWEALVENTKSTLEQTKLQRNHAKLDLLSNLDLKKEYNIINIAKKLEPKTEIIVLDKDIEEAFQNRPRLKALQLERENARKRYEIAKNKLWPSFSIGANYTAKGYDPNQNKAQEQSLNRDYSDYSVDFRLSYPIGDDKIEGDINSAKVDLEKLKLREKELKITIRNEIKKSFEEIEVSKKNLSRAQTSLSAMRAYYKGLLRRYKQGRYNSNNVKSALDSLVQAEQRLIESKINYNISLLRYDLARNKIFKKYNVNPDKVLDKMSKIL